MNKKQFQNWLVNQTPVFDEEIMKSIRIQDNWMGVIRSGRLDDHSMYLVTLEAVRKLSEGSAYRGPFKGCFLRLNR